MVWGSMEVTFIFKILILGLNVFLLTPTPLPQASIPISKPQSSNVA